IEDFPISKKYDGRGSIGNDDPFLAVLFQVLNYLDSIYARNVAEIDNTIKQTTVALDENWKGKVSTHVSIIREVIEKSTIQERLKQSIFGKLKQLQSEVDRNRARSDSAIDLFLDLTKAGGVGAENLGPV